MSLPPAAVLGLPPSCHKWLATRATDIRKRMDGLLAEVGALSADNPFARHLFIFPSHDATRIKILRWSDGGPCVFTKRLEKGHFRHREPRRIKGRWR